MIITIKNLQQQTFTVDFPAEKTILDLKRKIFLERGSEYLVEKQKLIYAGVILSDERTVASYNVDEKKFLVVMLKRDLVGASSASVQLKTDDSKDKISSDNKNETSNSGNKDNHESDKDTNNSAEAVDKTDTEVSNATKNTNSSSSSTNTGTGDIANTVPIISQAESNLLIGDDYNKSIDSIIEMGYSREMVERAMVASFNNPERAVEYLINGIPEVEAPSESQDNIRIQSNELRTDVAESRTDDPFEFLRNQPQFLQMRSLVYENPDLLHAVLQQIGQTNPALLQLISENQDAFLGMLNEPLDEGTSGGQQQRQRNFRGQSIRDIPISILGNEPQLSNEGNNARPQSDATERVSMIAAENQSPSAALNTSTETTAREVETNSNEQRRHNLSSGDRPTRIETEGGVTTLRLTSQDQDAIERLKALGFPETLVLQAYFACEKDEQLAANFLISSGFDD